MQARVGRLLAANRSEDSYLAGAAAILAAPIDIMQLKAIWSAALDDARIFISSRPPSEAGCLYYSQAKRNFVQPAPEDPGDAVPHFGRPGGVLPRFVEG